jgi:hypothetical protein
MVESRAWIVFFLVSIAGTNPALAQHDAPEEPRTWVLEDDSIIQGTLIEETSEDYRVNTIFGEVRINKADMKKTRMSQISTQHSTVKQEETISYRGTLATAELVALMMFPLAMVGVGDSSVMIWTGIFAHGFGGPLVHLYHGNYGKALGSIALRAGLPIGGAISLGLITEDWDGFALGVAAGLVIAPIIDIVFLASKTKSTTQDQTLIEYGSLKATPSFGVTPRGDLTFGLAGHF